MEMARERGKGKGESSGVGKVEGGRDEEL